MKKIIIFLALAFCLNGKAQNYVAIPDSNFVHYLKTIASTAFKGDSLDTTSVLVTTTTHSIICNSKNISDFTGISYFKSLRYLNCSNNGFFQNMPVLSDSLTYLNCSGNQFLQVLFIPTTLRYLNCALCMGLNFSTLPDSLRYLNCSSSCSMVPNSFPNLLDTLIAEYSGWSTIPSLPNSLVYLDLNTDNFFVLPSLPSTLKYLDVYDTFIACLPTLPDSLQYIDIRMTQVKCFPNFPSGASILEDSTFALCEPNNINGCPDVTTDVQKLKTENTTVNYYPNPANTELIIETNQTANYEVSLLDLNGKLILKQNINTKTKIDLKNINEGVYVLCIKSNQEIINKKIIISR